MPKAKAPLNFVLFKCIVSDEYFDYTLDDLSSMWTFVTIGYDGSIPVYQDKQEILSRKYFHDLNNNNHDVWRILNEKHAHIMIPLLFPKVILKKITLIPFPVTLSTDEKNFIAIIKKIKQTLSSPLHKADITNFLLGSDIYGTNIMSCLKRLHSLSYEDALNSCQEHYNLMKEGTVAQRILHSTGKTISLCNSSFVERNISSIINNSCQICVEDIVTSFALCGHGFCSSCMNMLRSKESERGMISCPSCRAELCCYDWMTIRGYIENNLMVNSKIQTLYNAINQTLLKRRQKKRLPLKALLVTPNNKTTLSISNLLKDYCHVNSCDSFDILSTVETRETHSLKPIVHIVSVDDLSKSSLQDESLEGVILACPQPINLYYKILQSCHHRTNILQLRVVFATHYEDIQDTLKVLFQ
jgi:antitoxin component of RelBE/YafQ-DinJ toxin-antitoxin module